MELDTNSDYPDVQHDANTMEMDGNFDKEMNFVDNGKISLHGNKKEDDNIDRPNVGRSLAPSKQQPMDVGGVQCNNKRSMEFTNSNDSASKKKVYRNRPYLLFRERFNFLVATTIGNARNDHKDRIFVLSDNSKNNTKDPFANGDNDPQTTRWPSKNNNPIAT